MPRSGLVVVTAPTVEPVTATEAKDWARITVTVEDSLVEGLITNARERFEEDTGRVLITQTWDYFLPSFPEEIEVPLPRLQSVTSVKYIDTDGAQQTLATSEYTVDTRSDPGRIVLAYGKAWPSIREVPNAVEVRFVAGYGPAGSDVPRQIRDALKAMTAALYENREPVTEALTGQQLTQVPIAYRDVVEQYRVLSWV